MKPRGDARLFARDDTVASTKTGAVDLTRSAKCPSREELRLVNCGFNDRDPVTKSYTRRFRFLKTTLNRCTKHTLSLILQSYISLLSGMLCQELLDVSELFSTGTVF